LRSASNEQEADGRPSANVPNSIGMNWSRITQINMNFWNILPSRRRGRAKSRPAKVTATVMALAFSVPAMASLGGNVGSIQADTARMNANVTRTEGDAYETHQLQSPTGTVVTEYLSSSGTVFAVTWHGPFMPDMQQILGSYFQQYSAALSSQASSQSRQYGRHPLDIRQPGLVLQTGGHMRAHWGRVYIPALAPVGVSPEQLQ
jgi:Protein of unknown function (DUF2844)